MKFIASRTNPLARQVEQLHSKKGRKLYNQFIGEGVSVITTLIAGGHQLDQLFVVEKHIEWAETITPNPIIVSAAVLDKISTTKSPSGIIGVFAIPAASQEEIKPGIVLADITNPGNMGTLLRTAAAMNVGSVILIEGCDPWNPKVIQASAGTIGANNLHILSWNELIANKGTTPLVALVVSEGQNPSKFTLKDSLIVIGNESRGISAEWLSACEFSTTLPMPGGTESLNAAVAGSIALYLGWNS